MQQGDWQQAVITFGSRNGAEETAAASLRPALAAAQDGGAITGWFFIRKFPCWRLRYRLAPAGTGFEPGEILDSLAAGGRITGWAPGIYEPETAAFGGPAAMDVAHDLFCADSSHVLDYLAGRPGGAPGAPGAGRREVAVLLASHLMRGAGQDWFEQGDIWATVAACRPGGRQAAQYDPQALKTAVRALMTADASPAGPLAVREPSGLLGTWSGAFDLAGQQLAGLARHGVLERGLRVVLAHHVIFAFNRLGLPYAEQGTLASLAAQAVMGEPGDGAARPGAGTAAARVVGMQTETTDADSLRHALAGQLLDQGTVRTAPVEQALRSVPRHLFVPAVPVQQAYADEPVYTKHGTDGTAVSAASQPTIVAMMLEQLQARPGQRILEIGAGTGYNAALLAHLAGEHGQVTTIDVDRDLTDSARSALAAAGYPDVRVILGDGALGYPPGAPYDRIIATVGAWDLPHQWLDQLAPGGRLLVPLRLRGSVTRSVAFERDGGSWRSLSSQMCGFMPLRASIAGDTRRIIPLTADASVTLQAHQDQDVDPGALAGVLDRPRTQEWTGVTFGNQQSVEWMDLWLACTMPNAVSRMPVQRQAVDAGLVTPMFRWGSTATAEDGTLAYLTFRPAPPSGDGSARSEAGVIAHGSRAADLAARVAAQIRDWDREYRTRTPGIRVQPAAAPEPVTGQFTFATPNNRLVISWE